MYLLLCSAKKGSDGSRRGSDPLPPPLTACMPIVLSRRDLTALIIGICFGSSLLTQASKHCQNNCLTLVNSPPGTSDARQQRAAVAEFFMTPEGAVPWQFKSALVT
jgi:hypothetical protein